MAEQKNMIVAGVGAERGVGGTLCLKFGEVGHHVFVAGRTAAKIGAIADTVIQRGGKATPVVTDLTQEADVIALFDAATEGGGTLDLAIYNAGNNTPGKIAEMEADYFESAWRIGLFGAFLFGREAARRMADSGGTLLFTGASSSMRGRAGFGAFTAAKGGLRNLAQAMAKECGPDGLHVGHVVVDGGINGDRLRERFPVRVKEMGAERLVDLDGIAEGFRFLYQQPKTAWSFEVDVRTYLESW
jgi:NAD(P)-dependent dehydrogenase (short-subunit alcohol dehydrogenase family)